MAHRSNDAKQGPGNAASGLPESQVCTNHALATPVEETGAAQDHVEQGIVGGTSGTLTDGVRATAKAQPLNTQSDHGSAVWPLLHTRL